jgi:hypothetical protein
MTAPSHGHAKLLDGGSIQIRLSQRRSSHPQSQTEHFFNSLIGCDTISKLDILV